MQVEYKYNDFHKNNYSKHAGHADESSVFLLRTSVFSSTCSEPAIFKNLFTMQVKKGEKLCSANRVGITATLAAAKLQAKINNVEKYVVKYFKPVSIKKSRLKFRALNPLPGAKKHAA